MSRRKVIGFTIENRVSATKLSHSHLHFASGSQHQRWLLFLCLGEDMYRYTGYNRRPFSAVCQNKYGREVIKTKEAYIDGSNIVEELKKAIPSHRQNAIEIDYLDKYYAGDQPILYRKKDVRPEINNKIVVNMAHFIVETKTSELCGEPIQYVLHGTDEEKSDEIGRLNAIMDGEDKAYYDIELCRWRSICGTAYRFIGVNNNPRRKRLLDEADFYLSVEDPRSTFIVYYDDGYPAFSCQIREDADGKTIYFCYTDSYWFDIREDRIYDSGINGNGAIPVIEYPNNERRLSDVELTIHITDGINKTTSDRQNGIEQFVSSWVKFVNCEIDSDTFAKMRMEGALVVKSNNRTENSKADVDVITTELNQSQTQVAIDSDFEQMLMIQGIADRQGNTGGDTQGAVTLRNGFYSMEKRSEIAEPIFKRSERNTLRIILNRLRIKNGFSLLPSDVEIKISRTKSDNMLVKAEVLQMLLNSGVNPERSIKTVGLFSDPEQVALESKERMDVLYPTTPEEIAAAPDTNNGETNAEPVFL